MNDDQKARLDALMRGRAEMSAAHDEQLKQSRMSDGEFRAAAADKLERVVRPAMEDVSAHLRRGGYRCGVDHRTVTVVGEGETMPVVFAMAMEVVPPDGGRPRQLTFLVVAPDKKIHIASGKPGDGPARAILELSELTPEAVTDQLVEFLEEAPGR